MEENEKTANQGTDEVNQTTALVPETASGDMTPANIVLHLDRYIVGQKQAKRVVAIALRNRIRRARVTGDLRDEIIPKNILMIGPTGVGKTEIARRLAALMDAPFIKVEATKYTEVGYVGRDVEGMIRDLAEAGIRMVKARKQKEVEAKAAEAVTEKLLDILLNMPKGPRGLPPKGEFVGDLAVEDELEQISRLRERYRRKLVAGDLDTTKVVVEVGDAQPKMFEIFSNSGIEELGVNIQDMLGNVIPKKTKSRTVDISEARKILTAQEAEKLIDMDAVTTEALKLVEQQGIVFIDEIDKIVGGSRGSGPDVSREGVQRDILPIVEGCTVVTKYGPVKTDHILFIAAGAFSMSKPSDLVPELQGRFPLRVELESLSTDDFKRILTEPRNALIKQYVALLEADGVELDFTEDGIVRIAEIASQVNQQTEDIGARRLHTLLEKVLEEVSFDAPDSADVSLKVDSAYVNARLKGIADDVDLSRYIL